MNKILPNKKAYAVLLLILAVASIGFLAMLIIIDILPKGFFLGFTGLVLLVLIFARLLLGNKKKAGRIIGTVLTTILLLVYGTGIYFMHSTYAMLSKISVDEGSGAEVNVTEESFNIYITGIDQWESEKGLDLERSDVNMIVTVNPKTKKILLTSIPRDAYVPLAMNGKMDKLTHSGVYGVDETINTVSKWTGVKIDYYVKMNFSAVVDVINAIGGIDVYSDKTFVPTKRCWYTVEKGWNHMNGKEALAFARERKAYNNEDSMRVENQQKVVEACIKKLTSSPVLLTKYDDILSAASENMQISMPTSAIQSLVKLQLAYPGAWGTEMQKMEGEYDEDYVYSLTQESKFVVYKIPEENKEKAVEKINATMNPSEEELKAAEQNRWKQLFKNFFVKGEKNAE